MAATDRSAYQSVTYEERGAVAWITLNRPDRLNSVDAAMVDELGDIWRSLRFNDDVRVAVLTGSGDKAFCTGIDRDWTVPQSSSPFMPDDPLMMIGPKRHDLWKPVIGAVNGMACGGAFYLLAECDVLIAAERATFFDPHVTYGMAAVYEPMLMLQRMPLGEILRLSILGNHERLSAARARDIGLLSDVVPADRLIDEAGWIAAAVASQPSVAVQGTIKAIWTAVELGLGQALQQAPALVTLGNQPEALAEGQQSFKSGTRIEPRIR